MTTTNPLLNDLYYEHSLWCIANAMEASKEEDRNFWYTHAVQWQKKINVELLLLKK